MAKFSLPQFFERFPNDDACLGHLMEVRHGLRHECVKCEKDATFHRITGRRAYACSQCGDHVYPCAGTIFQDSRTPLTLWFYTVFLFVTTRHGVSARELKRQIGVTLKTAHSMGHQVRKLMARADSFQLLAGHVEADETYVGGRRSGTFGRGAANKTIVFGMKERSGRLAAEVIPDVRMPTLRKAIRRNVAEGSTVSTDEFASYGLLKDDGYTHGVVRHSDKEYVRGVHHTNSVENFWKIFKTSIKSTHVHVSSKYFDRYRK